MQGNEQDLGEELETTEVEETTTEETPKNESATDTVRRAYAELQKKATGEDSGDGDNEPEQIKTATEEAAQEEVTQPGLPGKPNFGDIRPPERFTLEQKEHFNRLPKKTRHAIVKLVKEQEAYFTERTKELNTALEDTKGITEEIRPYLPIWGQRGLSPRIAIRALAAEYTKLLQNPLDHITGLVQKTGIPVHTLMERLGYQPSGEASHAASKPAPTPAVNIWEDPKLQQLTNFINELYTERISQSESAKAELRSTIEDEFYSVRDEKDQNGRYRYPKLHDDQFVKQAEPLVLAFAKTFPNLSWGDRLKKAYHTMTGSSGNFANGVQTGLPASNQEQVARARAASVSLRGNGSVSAPQLTAKDIPQSGVDTARMAYNMLMNRGA